jgi:hypothetical protein
LTTDSCNGAGRENACTDLLTQRYRKEADSHDRWRSDSDSRTPAPDPLPAGRAKRLARAFAQKPPGSARARASAQQQQQQPRSFSRGRGARTIDTKQARRIGRTNPEARARPRAGRDATRGSARPQSPGGEVAQHSRRNDERMRLVRRAGGDRGRFGRTRARQRGLVWLVSSRPGTVRP